MVAGQYGMLGSIDANTGVPHLGWDTDCFMSDTQQVKEGGLEGWVQRVVVLLCVSPLFPLQRVVQNTGVFEKHFSIADQFFLPHKSLFPPFSILQTTLIMKTVLEQGGIAPGGLNFDAKVRRESTALEDIFIAHILGMVSSIHFMVIYSFIHSFIYSFIHLFIHLFLYLSTQLSGRLRQGAARGRSAAGGWDLAWDGVGAVCELQGGVWKEAGGGEGHFGRV